MQWTYNVTLRSVCVTIVFVEKRYYIFWGCVFIPRHPACNAHVPYFIDMWPIWLYNIFPLYLINGTICGRKGCWTENVCFDFLYNVYLQHFSFWEELSEIWLKMYIGLHVKYRYFCSILVKLEYSLQIFEKCSNMKYHENASSENRDFQCGKKDRQMVELIVAFRNFAKTPKICFTGNLETPSHLWLTWNGLCWKCKLQR